jgi:hypothetical protein
MTTATLSKNIGPSKIVRKLTEIRISPHAMGRPEKSTTKVAIRINRPI